MKSRMHNEIEYKLSDAINIQSDHINSYFIDTQLQLDKNDSCCHRTLSSHDIKDFFDKTWYKIILAKKF